MANVFVPSDRNRKALIEAVARRPRARLAALPTPLQDCPRFSKALGGPRILVKRDDLTGLALGGNKTRKLEFYIGDAISKGAEVLVTGAAAQSNHSRQTAAAAAQLGLKCVLVLRGKPDLPKQGNLLIDDLVGADVRLYPVREMTEIHALIHKVGDELRAKGLAVYDFTGLEAVGLAGYANMILELTEQLEELRVGADHIYTCSGSGTQAGIIVGAKALGWPVKIVGIAPGDTQAVNVGRLHRVSNELAGILGLPIEVTRDEIANLDSYIGPGYGVVTRDGVEALRLLARTEGILLDPIYTAKAMCGLIDHVRKGLVRPDDTVVFVHTGGHPGLFAFAEEIVKAS